MTEEQKRLFADNYRLVYYWAWRFTPEYGKLDDYVNAGCEALIRAVTTFKPAGASIHTYASKCIYRAMKRVREQMSRKRMLAYSESTDDFSEDEIEAFFEPYDEPGFEIAENRMILEKAFHGLSDDDRHLLSLRYEDGLSTCKIAKMRGVSTQAVAGKLNRLLDKMWHNITGKPRRERKFQ